VTSVGRRVAEIVGDDSAATVEDLLVRVRTGKTRRDTGHAQLLLPSGERRWLRLSLAAAGEAFEGHPVLVAVAERLRGCVRTTDLVARLGGDEFVVVLFDAEEATTTARRIVDAVAAPVSLDGVEHAVRASVGVALVSRRAQTFDASLRAADAALYEVKRAGKNGYAVAP
jgi:hypothetical protein